MYYRVVSVCMQCLGRGDDKLGLFMEFMKLIILDQRKCMMHLSKNTRLLLKVFLCQSHICLLFQEMNNLS